MSITLFTNRRYKNRRTYSRVAPLEKDSLLKRQSVRKWKLKSMLPHFTSMRNILRVPNMPAMRFPRFFKMSMLEGKWLFYISSVLLIVMLAVWFAQLGYGQGGIEKFEPVLPEIDATITGEMLAYASPESEARGSGDINFPERPIVTSVTTHSYTVKRGDTLSEIAAKNNLDVGTLISFNKIDDVRRLMAGIEITIPDIDGVPYTVQRGDSLDKIAERYNVTLENILDANDLQTALIQPGQKLFVPGAEISEYEYKKAMGTLFIYPTAGRITSGFGYRADPFTGVRRMHYGLDLANRTGTLIKATMAGRVVAVGDQPRGYGKYIVIKHNHGFQSLYGHLSTIEVNRNQYVAQGQRIGLMGNSGRSTGSHLHFSLYKNNIPVNPLGGYLYK